MIKIALVGGTHGNEPVGLEVMNLFKNSTKRYRNDYSCFWGNPKAYELQKRYVDTDLNRAFGKRAIRKGYEEIRANELQKEIEGHFDFCIDLHTTTSNMGLTAILNNTHVHTRMVCADLHRSIESMKLIEEDSLDSQCNHLNRLCPAGVTVEVGPVANNVINGKLVFAMFDIVEKILDFDFSSNLETTQVPVYKMVDTVFYPEGEHWYLHSDLEQNDFKRLERGAPVFINNDREIKFWEKEPVYPFFINEAAYLEKRSAFLVAKKRQGLIKP